MSGQGEVVSNYNFLNDNGQTAAAGINTGDASEYDMDVRKVSNFLHSCWLQSTVGAPMRDGKAGLKLSFQPIFSPGAGPAHTAAELD